MRPLDKLLVDEVLSLLLLTTEYKVSHLVQVLGRGGAVVIVGTTAPERVLVQLDLVGLRTAIDHATQTTIANRQGLKPYLGGGVVP